MHFSEAPDELSGPKGIFRISFQQIAGYFSYKLTQCAYYFGKPKMFLLSKLSKIEFLVMNFVCVK